jgi:hypothetical protein
VLNSKIKVCATKPHVGNTRKILFFKTLVEAGKPTDGLRSRNREMMDLMRLLKNRVLGYVHLMPAFPSRRVTTYSTSTRSTSPIQTR